MGSQEFFRDLARKMVVEMLIQSEYRGRGWGSEEKCQTEMKKKKKKEKRSEEKWGPVKEIRRGVKMSSGEGC